MGEYISREAALTVLDWDCASQDALEAIKSIPAADVVEVRHGRWEQVEILHVEDLNEEDKNCILIASMFCPKCKRYHNEVYLYGSPTEMVRYCPSCGAKMDDNVIQHTECVGNALGALDEVEELRRYIDANKLADELSKVPWYERKDEKQAVRMVKEFPAADVVEVVRCADCKYDERCMFQDFVRENRVVPYDKTVFFCADGKRKDGGQDDGTA